MEHYMDEKWKLSRDDKNFNSHSSSKSTLSRSGSQKTFTKCPFLRSSSQKNNTYNLSRSSLQKSALSKSSRTTSSSQKCAEFTRKCSSLAKEQKAKFYIAKRCITMLVGWKKNGDS